MAPITKNVLELVEIGELLARSTIYAVVWRAGADVVWLISSVARVAEDGCCGD
jgi:hypothetical protein